MRRPERPATLAEAKALKDFSADAIRQSVGNTALVSVMDWIEAEVAESQMRLEVVEDYAEMLRTQGRIRGLRDLLYHLTPVDAGK